MSNDQDQNTCPQWAWFVLFVVLRVSMVIVLIVLAIAAYRSVRRESLPFLVVGNGLLIYIDKAFGDDTSMVLAASLTCTFLFATANWLMMSPKRGLRRMGWGIWGLTLSAIVIIVMGYYSLTPRYILGQLFHPLHLSSQLATLVQTVPKSDFWKLTVIVMSTLLIVVLFLGLPLWTRIFRRHKDTDTTE